MNGLSRFDPVMHREIHLVLAHAQGSHWSVKERGAPGKTSRKTSAQSARIVPSRSEAGRAVRPDAGGEIRAPSGRRLAHSRVDGYISPRGDSIRNGRSHGSGNARTDRVPCIGARKVPGGNAAVSGLEVLESMHVPVCRLHRRMVRAASGASRQEMAMQARRCEPVRLSPGTPEQALLSASRAEYVACQISGIARGGKLCDNDSRRAGESATARERDILGDVGTTSSRSEGLEISREENHATDSLARSFAFDKVGPGDR